jgi:hypothetical protein
MSELRKLGCTITPSGSGHWKVTREGYTATVIVSKTPKTHRGMLNARGDVRRYLGLDI